MKLNKWILLVCIVTGIVVLCIFARHEDFDTGIIRADGINTDITDTRPCEFSARYIRTDGYHEDVKYPIVKVIRSSDELNAYYEANRSLYSFERMEEPALYDNIVFLDARDKYDEAYFKNRILIMVLLEEVSGSIRHKVNNINYVGNTAIINIERIIPEACTDDMAVWHILIEPEAGFDIPDEANINVLVENYEKIPMLASWSYNYGNVEELTKYSDIIAIVSVNGMEAYSEHSITLTKYSAKVEELLYGEEDDIEIVMTGGIDEKEKKIYEILDDPLMEKGDEYLIFAKKNEDGTYTVLSGSQGRFVIEDDKVFPLNSDISVTWSGKSDFFDRVNDALVKYNKNV